MTNLENVQRVITWNSKKLDDGNFIANVYSFDHGVEAVVHCSYTCDSRAKAVTRAKKAVRFLKAKRA